MDRARFRSMASTVAAMLIVFISGMLVNSVWEIQNGHPALMGHGKPNTSAALAYDYSGESVDTICTSGCTFGLDTTCHFVTAKNLNRLINGLDEAQSGTITFYLNESSASCTSNVQIQDQPATTQFQDIQVPITSGTGFSFKWSVAPTGALLITFN